MNNKFGIFHTNRGDTVTSYLLRYFTGLPELRHISGVGEIIVKAIVGLEREWKEGVEY